MKRQKSIMWILIVTLLFSVIGINKIQANSDAEILSGLNPVLILSSYEILEGTVTNGEEIKVRFYVTNSNQYADAYNVIVSYYTEDGGLFLPMGASNQAYIEKVERGQTAYVDMILQVSETFSAEALNITIMMEYSNFIGDGFSNTTALTPNFTKKSELQINSVFLAKSAVVNTKSLLNITYKNIGETNITRITMKLEGNIGEEQKIVELDGVDKEKQNIFDYYINFLETGKQKIIISFEYEDENGTIQEIESQEYEIEVVSKADEVQQIEPEHLENTNAVIWLYGAVVFFLIAILVLVVLIWMRWHKNSKTGGKQNE